MDISTLLKNNPTILVPLGAITAAIIGGIFSYISLVISKENEISKFRQAWIDGIRAELAEFIAASESLATILYNYNKKTIANNETETPKSFFDLTTENVDLHNKMINNYRNILLRLNIVEHYDLEAKLHDVYKEFHKHPIDPKKLRKLNITLVEVSRKVLKTEWKVVKRGERIFFVTKIVALLVIVFFAYRFYLIIE